MDYIYLVPGNWFELKNINAAKSVPYDIESLTAEILNQVHNRAENLKIIDITYGKVYKNIKDEDICFHLNENKFQKIAEMLTTEKRHPIITFHGTDCLKTVEAIMNEGYIIPGTKKNVRVKNGAVYGKGIYSSPHFDKALAYTRVDDKGCMYVLINFMLLGIAKMISPQAREEDNKSVDNRIVFGLDQIITKDANKIIPVGYIKMKI
uniref:PARP catalytic domain-containing protein n=1 Tax=viral metagenome TaxID=1070528 RepID=A0A6C0C805_9ZZZZ